MLCVLPYVPLKLIQLVNCSASQLSESLPLHLTSDHNEGRPTTWIRCSQFFTNCFERSRSPADALCFLLFLIGAESALQTPPMGLFGIDKQLLKQQFFGKAGSHVPPAGEWVQQELGTEKMRQSFAHNMLRSSFLFILHDGPREIAAQHSKSQLLCQKHPLETLQTSLTTAQVLLPALGLALLSIVPGQLSLMLDRCAITCLCSFSPG